MKGFIYVLSICAYAKNIFRVICASDKFFNIIKFLMSKNYIGNHFKPRFVRTCSFLSHIIALYAVTVELMLSFKISCLTHRRFRYIYFITVSS